MRKAVQFAIHYALRFAPTDGDLDVSERIFPECPPCDEGGHIALKTDEAQNVGFRRLAD